MGDSVAAQSATSQRITSSTYTKGPKALVAVFVRVLVPAAILLLVWGAPKAWNGLRWILAEWYDAIGWFPLLVFGVLALGLLVQTIRRIKAEKQSADGKSTPWHRALAPCLSTIVLGAVFNGSLNIASNQVDAHFQGRKEHTVKIYQNHDLAKLSGQCIRLAMLRHADRMTKGPERDALEDLAADAPGAWQQLADANDPRVLALADAKLTEFIREPKAKALHQDQWRALLVDWRTAANATVLGDPALNAAAKTIAEDFGITLREALKADFEKDGKAWAAMQLDIAQQMLNRTPVSMATGNDQINAALADVKAILADEAKGLPALHRTILDARQAQDEHARTVTRNFDQVVGMLQRIQADVTVIKEVTAETKADVKEVKADTQESKTDIKLIQLSMEINDRIKRIEVDPTLAPAQRQELTLALLDQKQALQVPGQPAAPVPADVQAAVKDIFKDAPDVVRFAALARVGLDKEADELAREIDRTSKRLSPEEKYEFFVARGDRYWNATDFWNAATWYAQAMALDVKDPAVVHRAARSAILAPGRATYTQDVQLAQSWVERCLAKLAKQPDASMIDTARLHAILATTLSYQGKSSAAIAPAREALRLLAKEKDAPAGQTYGVLIDAAHALLYAGARPEAAAAADRAVNAQP